MKVQFVGKHEQITHDLHFLLRCRWDDVEVARIEDIELVDTSDPSSFIVIGYDCYTHQTVSLVEQFHLDARCVVLVISAGRIPVAAQVAVLRAGADDVWDGFPPDTALGIARFVALRRRTIAEEVLRYRKLNIYPEAREVIVGGNESVRLTPAEFRLLHTLALHHERVLTFDHLMDTVWEETTTSRSALRKLVQRLRKKLGRHAGVSIESQTGVGYRLMPAGDETLSRPTMLHS